ncbi:MAG TPA: CPBP family intramembrane glutamic endopeptidase [Steroidobacteraceae bacterium]|nr:CPBP family intramembrane glutamic endopeptidase [Steroidobacteraceae bacterium]
MLALLGAWAYGGTRSMARFHGALHPQRVRLYLFSIGVEWLVFAVVVAGVVRARTPLSCVLGERWRSSRELLRDIAVAAAFWLAAMAGLILFEWVLKIRGTGTTVLALLPRGAVESALWVALAVSAGICEETIFRGYLQRQLIAMTGRPDTGLVLAAMIFGLGHLYQGWRMAIVIGVYGLMFGVLAYRRRSVRPGMIAHAWHDAFSGVLYSLLLRR